MTPHSWIHQLWNRSPRSPGCKAGHRRSEQRRKRSLNVWLEALEDRLAPANIVVVNNADSGPGSLRQAIMDSAAGDTISFAPTLVGATITLTQANGPLSISQDLTINGPGADQLTVSGCGTTDVFSIGPTGHVAINGLKVTAGHADVGAGISILAAVVTLTGVDVEGNTATYGGGGVLANYGTLSISNSTIANNTATYGAGIEALGSQVTITNSTIANNVGTTNREASGIVAVGDPTSALNLLSLESSTLSGNTAGGAGQAADICVEGHHSTQTLTLHNTILNGAAANPAGTPNVVTRGGGSIMSLGHNICSDATANLTAAGDLPGTNPLLGTFGNHGGATPTFDLLFNSPAINNADPLGGAPSCDQRGAIRGAPSGLGSMANAGIAPDIGAFEFSSLYVVTSSDASTTPAAYDTSLIGTLRGGVEWANSNINLLVPNATPNLIVFDTAGTFATPQTITLALGPLTLSNSTVPEAITGPGVTAVTVSGNHVVQVFRNSNNVTSTLSGMTMTEGHSNFQGGAILNFGTLEIRNAAITNSSANLGGGLANLYGNLTVRYSTIAGNSAIGNGALGGGVQNSYGSAKLTIDSSTLSGNSALNDAAIGQDSGSPAAMIINSTISGNTSTNSGTVGGSVGTITLLNSTLAGNTSPSGAFSSQGTTLSAKDTIFANVGPNFDSSANFTSLGHNLISDNSGSGFMASDRRNVDPLLGPLADNGGPTFTMALQPGSPAIDQGDLGGAPAFDQRGPGFPRTINGTIDIGAIEYTPPPSTTVIAINRGTPAGPFTNASMVTYTVSFATATLGLRAGNLSLTGTAGAGAIGTPTTSDGGQDWSVSVTGLGSANGTLILNLVNDTGLDHGVSNIPFAGQAYTLDHVPPTVSMTSAAPNPTHALSITVAVTVSKPTTDFTATALVVGNGSVSNFTGGGTSYTFTLSPNMLGTATTVDVPANAFHDAVGNGNAAATQFSRTFLAPIAVQDFQINPFDTTKQRSMVTTLQVTFNTLITFDAGAFTLAGDNSVVLHALDTTPSGGTCTVVTITFSGPTIIGHSLADGRYSLTVHGGHIHAGADVMATDRVFSFFRFYGDINGDGKVDGTDLTALYGVLNGDPAYAQYRFAFDYYADGRVDQDDYVQFFQRLGKSLP